MRFCCSSIAALITHLHGGIRWCGGSSRAGFYYELVEAGSCAVVQGTVWSAAQAGGRGSNLHYWQPECLRGRGGLLLRVMSDCQHVEWTDSGLVATLWRLRRFLVCGVLHGWRSGSEMV